MTTCRRVGLTAACVVAIGMFGLPSAGSARATTAQAAGAGSAPFRFALSTSHGPSGTAIKVASIDPCPPPAGASEPEVFVSITVPTRVGGAASGFSYGFAVSSTGDWAGTISFNTELGTPGPTAVTAECSAQSIDPRVYVTYAAQPFEITTAGLGYRIADVHGDLLGHGDASGCVNVVPGQVTSPVVAMSANPVTGDGSYLATADGGVFTQGDAVFYGSMGAAHLRAPIVGIGESGTGDGYWLAAADGGVFSFGDAAFLGSLASSQLAAPIVGIAPTRGGFGYWLVAADGAVFGFGDAKALGSTAGMHLNQPIVGIVGAPYGTGYWLVGRDGGVFAFGDAQFYGSAANLSLNAPVVAMAASRGAPGYWLLAADGGVFSFGGAAFYGTGRDNCYPKYINGVPQPEPQLNASLFAAISATPDTTLAANSNTPPVGVLAATAATQTAVVGTYCWQASCTIMDGGAPDPPPLAAAPGEQLALRFVTDQTPTAISASRCGQRFAFGGFGNAGSYGDCSDLPLDAANPTSFTSASTPGDQWLIIHTWWTDGHVDYYVHVHVD